MPIRGPNHAGANARAGCAGPDPRPNGAAFRVNSAGPIQLFGKARRRKKCAVGAIKHVEKAVSVCLNKEFSRLTMKGRIHKDRSFGCVVVKKVVWRELEIPFEFT